MTCRHASGPAATALETDSPAMPGKLAHISRAGQAGIFGYVPSLTRYDRFDAATHMPDRTASGLTSALFLNCTHLACPIPDNNMPFNGIRNCGTGAFSVGPVAVNFHICGHSACTAW